MREGLLGAVLAGGESRRFGSPKALAPFRGEPMVLRAARTLGEVCGQVVVVSSVPEVESALRGTARPVSLLPDRVPGAGPLAGLHAALHHAREEGLKAVLLLACDMPLVTPEIAEALAREGEAVDALAVVAAQEGGADAGAHRRLSPQPLLGWYRLEALSSVETRLVGEDRSMRGLLAALEARVMPPEELGAGRGELAGANTPEELARLEGVGADHPPAVSVVGFKNSGKTGVAVALVAELRRRGLRVGALKHGHHFRLDTPGTDSWRLTHEGGADPVLLAGPEGFAFMGSWTGDREPGPGALLARHFSGMDLVVVEGYKGEPLPRVEVHRVGSEAPLLCVEEGSDAAPFLALVVDDPDGVSGAEGLPVLRWGAPDTASRLADLVEEAVLGVRPARGVKG
jgi:molybdopterin-guanine dinucleotide biosynthesis protein MobB